MDVQPGVLPRVVRPNTAHGARTERQLDRFEPRFQPRIRQLAARHPYLTDLATTFPALLFALAIPRRDIDASPCIADVIAGTRLAPIANKAAVAMWLRALPPQAFTRPIGQVPDSEKFRRSIPARIPSAAKNLPNWLATIELANAVADEDVALWLANELKQNPRLAQRTRKIVAVCLWAWFSRNSGSIAHDLVTDHWHPSVKLANTRRSVSGWLENIQARSYIGRMAFEDPWLDEASIDGYEFIPMLTAQAICDEAAAMQHCLASYGQKLGIYGGNIWSVRKQGVRVATVELARSCCNTPTICQAEGVRNADLPDEVCTAIATWFARHQRTLPVRPKREGLKADAWQELWRPYWLAKKKIPSWLPLTPTENALERLLNPGRY